MDPKILKDAFNSNKIGQENNRNINFEEIKSDYDIEEN